MKHKKTEVQTHSSWRQRKKLKKKFRESKLLGQLDKKKRIDTGDYPGGKQQQPGSVKFEDPENETEEIFGEEPTTSDQKVRPFTLAVAIPGSILTNAQSLELRTYLAGQIARSCGIFRVDEIVVFDEYARLTKKGDRNV